jgi:glycosyltransferase involved in cell wall biosynthesis
LLNFSRDYKNSTAGMKILMLTPYIPYPLNEGGTISQFAIIDYLRKENEITLVLTSTCEKDDHNISELKRLFPEVHVEVLALKKGPGAQQRTKGLTSFLRKINFFINKLKSSSAYKTPALTSSVSEIDNPHFVNISKVKKRKLVEQLARVISHSKPDIVQIDIISFIDLALAIPAGIKKVFVHHEVRFARLMSSIATSSDSPTPYDDYALALARQQELMFLRLYDAVFVFSEDDKQKLKLASPDLNVFVTPFPVLDNYFQEIPTQNTDIEKLVFIGGERHAPNKDAIEWYIKEILPEVNKVEKLVLHIVGDWSAETISRYNHIPQIRFAGFVEDTVEYFRNSVMVVPVRVGSGIRTKILYAMAQGVPVISASVGCEGIAVRDQESILIANTPKEFAEAVHKITTDPLVTLRLIQNAQKIAKMKYSQSTAGQLRLNILKEL